MENGRACVSLGVVGRSRSRAVYLRFDYFAFKVKVNNHESSVNLIHIE